MYNHLLELILEYKMTKEEACALKILVLYLELAHEHFPGSKHYYSLPKNKDVRKSELFKYCIKLYRETKDKISFSDYRLYVQAQMMVIKNISVNGATPLFTPSILTGEKAWARWKVWHKFASHTASQSVEETDVKVRPTDIFLALDRTKMFLERRLDGLTCDKIKEALKSRAIFRWVAIGQMSPYYLVLSPLAKEWLERSDVNLLTLGIDVKLYKSTTEISEYFKKVFTSEFL